MRLLRIDRPIRITRNTDRDWCWACWCCPAPACWTTHTAGTWTAVLHAAEVHLRTEHPAYEKNDDRDDETLGRAA